MLFQVVYLIIRLNSIIQLDQFLNFVKYEN